MYSEAFLHSLAVLPRPASFCSTVLPSSHGADSTATTTTARTSYESGRASAVTYEPGGSFLAIATCSASRCYSPGVASRLTSLYGSHSSSSPPLSRANSCITAASRPSAATLFALDAAESGGTEASTGRPNPPSTGRATSRGSAGQSTTGRASSSSPPRACSSPPPPSAFSYVSGDGLV